MKLRNIAVSASVCTASLAYSRQVASFSISRGPVLENEVTRSRAALGWDPCQM